MSRRRFKAVWRRVRRRGRPHTDIPKALCERGRGRDGTSGGSKHAVTRRGGTATTPIQSPRTPPGRRGRPSSWKSSSSWRRSDKDEKPRRRVVRMKPAARLVEARGGGEGAWAAADPEPIGLRPSEEAPVVTRDGIGVCTVAEAWRHGCPLARLRGFLETSATTDLARKTAAKRNPLRAADPRETGPKPGSKRPKSPKIALVAISASYR